MEYLYCISRSDDNKLLINKYKIDEEISNQYTLDNGYIIDKALLNTHANNGVYSLNSDTALIIMKKHTELQMIKAEESFISHGEFYDIVCQEIDNTEAS